MEYIQAIGLLVLSQNRLFLAEHNIQIDNPAHEKHNTLIKVESVECWARVALLCEIIAVYSTLRSSHAYRLTIERTSE